MAPARADIHSPALTIRESLVFSAECRLIIDDQNQLQEFVDEVSCHACCLHGCLHPSGPGIELQG